MLAWLRNNISLREDKVARRSSGTKGNKGNKEYKTIDDIATHAMRL